MIMTRARRAHRAHAIELEAQSRQARLEREAEADRIRLLHIRLALKLHNELVETRQKEKIITLNLDLASYKPPSNKGNLAAHKATAESVVLKLNVIHDSHFKKAEKIESESAALIAALPVNVRQTVKPSLDIAKNDKLRELRLESEAERQGLIAVARTLKSFADEHGPRIGNPLTASSLFGFGSEAKARALAEIATADHATVKALAAYAKASGDKTLASALLTRNMAFDRGKRPIDDSMAFAAIMFADEIQAVPEISKAIGLAFDTATALNDSISGKGTSPMAKLEIGLRHGEAGRVVPVAGKRFEVAEMQDDGSI